MRLGLSIVGAVVGAVVGVAVQGGLERALGYEASWIAVIIGVLTGLGARMLAGSCIKETSYCRGALVAAIAMVAIIGGSHVASSLMQSSNVKEFKTALLPPPLALDNGRKAKPADAKTRPAAQSTTAKRRKKLPVPSASPRSDGPEKIDVKVSTPADDHANGASTASKAAGEKPAETRVAPDSGEPVSDEVVSGARAMKPPPLSPVRFVFFAVGTLVAYQLARGGSSKSAGETAPAE